MKLIHPFFIFFLTFTKFNAQVVTQFVSDNDMTETISLAFYGNDLYFSSWWEEIWDNPYDDIYKISKIDITESTPTMIDVVILPSLPGGMVFKDNYLYFAHGYTISKIDITENVPTIIDIKNVGSRIEGMAIHENELYFTNDDEISKIDITETTPMVVNVANDLDSPHDLVFKGNELYFSNQYQIKKIDITETAPSPDLVSNVGYSRGLAFDDDILFIAKRIDGKIYSQNVTVPPNPSLLHTSYTAYNDIALLNDDLFITGFYNIYKIENISDLITLSVSDNTLSPNKYKIYPNPTFNEISILGLRNQEVFTIYDIFGKKILKGVISKDEKIDVKNLSNGFFFMELGNRNGLKFIKK